VTKKGDSHRFACEGEGALAAAGGDGGVKKGDSHRFARVRARVLKKVTKKVTVTVLRV